MEPILVIVGIVIGALGTLIWRFRWIHLLGNIRADEVDPVKKSEVARFAGQKIMLMASIVLFLGLLIPQATTEQQELITVFGALVGMFVVAGFYLKGLERYRKK